MRYLQGKKPVWLAIGLASLVVLTGCGSDSDSDSSSDSSKSSSSALDGKKLFSDNCSSCHALAAADATGALNLDDKAPLTEDRVAKQIKNGGNGMPGGILEGKEAAEVAKFVSENAKKK